MGVGTAAFLRHRTCPICKFIQSEETAGLRARSCEVEIPALEAIGLHESPDATVYDCAQPAELEPEVADAVVVLTREVDRSASQRRKRRTAMLSEGRKGSLPLQTLAATQYCLPRMRLSQERLRLGLRVKKTSSEIL